MPSRGQFSCPHGAKGERVKTKDGRSRCNTCNRERARRRTGYPIEAPKHPPGRKPKTPRPFKCGHPRDSLHLGYATRKATGQLRAYCKACQNAKTRARRGLPPQSDLEFSLASTERDLKEALAEANWETTRIALRAFRNGAGVKP